MSTVKRALWLTLILIISGCNAMNINDFKNKQPELVLEEYFSGTTWAWGIFEDRFGNLRRSFQVTIKGTMEDGRLILDEDFFYDDQTVAKRIWTITPLGDGQYRGRADDIIGEAIGHTAGNALNWRYEMNLPVAGSDWRVRFNDWMFLQPGRVMINKAEVSKWGIHIGTVTLFFSKQKPEL